MLGAGHTRRPVGPPDGIADEVRHVVVQIFDQIQNIVNEKDRVIVPVQDPLIILHAIRHVGNEGRHGSPAQQQYSVIRCLQLLAATQIMMMVTREVRKTPSCSPATQTALYAAF